jgi:hypothetical protein
LKTLIEQWKKGLVAPAFLGLLEEKAYDAIHPERFTPKK